MHHLPVVGVGFCTQKYVPLVYNFIHILCFQDAFLQDLFYSLFLPQPLNDISASQVADLASANASEEDKIAAMMNQAGEEWDPSLYVQH